MSKDKKTSQSQQTTTNGTFANNGTTSSTSQGTAPDWISTLMKGLSSNIGTLAGSNPANFVAPQNTLQTQAGATAGRLTGMPSPYGAALDETGYVMGANAPRTSAVTAAQFIPNYMDPALSAVVNTSLADFDKNAGDTRASQDLQLAGSGAFGGSGAALTKSATEGELARARASTDANLRSNAFTQALGAAQQDATRKQSANDTNAGLYAGQMDRALSAAGQLGNLGSQYESGVRADATTQQGIGDALRAITQQQATAPLDLASWASSAIPGMLSGFFGNTSNGTTSSTGNSNQSASGTGSTINAPSQTDKAGQALQVAATLASMFSDVRLKRDIRRIGTHPLGVGIYTYEYAWGGPRQVGVLAQEVLGVKPSAVAMHASGYLMVDYGSI